MNIINPFKAIYYYTIILVYTYSNLYHKQAIISMGRFDSLKENTFSKSKNGESNSRRYNRRNQDELSRSTLPSETRVRRFNNTIASNKEEDFPELVKTEKKDTPTIQPESSWQSAMKQREEEEQRSKEGTINQNDPKYWRGAKWIGPMLIRQKSYPDSWYQYMETASKGHASSYLCPFRETEYSRDGTNWYLSWNETFSETQLQRMEYEEEEEQQFEQSRILEKYRQKLEEESDKYYEEMGELDGYAIARLEHEAYEKYAEQFDIEIPVEDIDDEDSDDYLEDDN